MDSSYIALEDFASNTLFTPLLTSLCELNVGDASILPRAPPDTSPYWIYLRWKRQGSSTIHISAIDCRFKKERFVAYVVKQNLFTEEEAHLVYILASTYFMV